MNRRLHNKNHDLISAQSISVDSFCSQSHTYQPAGTTETTDRSRIAPLLLLLLFETACVEELLLYGQLVFALLKGEEADGRANIKAPSITFEHC